MAINPVVIMKKSILFLASAAAILAGCAREATIETPETGRKHITIQATVNPETRTTVDIADGVGTYAWTDNEQIAVFESTADVATPFTVNDPENGYFDGTIEAGNTLIGAVSPKSAVTEMVSVDGEVEYTLSLSGVYNQGETNAVMVAGTPETIESDPDSEPLYKFQFKHAAGLMKVTYVNLPVGTAGVKFSTNKPITGTVDLETLTGVEIKNTDVQGDSEAFVLYENPVTEVNTTGEFYIPVPTGSYTGFTICLVDDGFNPIPGTTKSKSTAFTVERADIIRIPTVTLQAVDTSEKFVKVTSNSDLTDGTYLIVYEGGKSNGVDVPSVAFNGGLQTLDADENGIEVTISDDAIPFSTALEGATFDISVTAGTILASNGKYIGVSTNSNGLKVSESATVYSNSFSIDGSGNAVIEANFEESVMSLRYNYASDELRFRYYKNNGQQPIALYKMTSGASSAKTDPGLSFSESSVTAEVGDESFDAPTLTNPYELTVTYESSDENVAMVDENGEVVIMGAGTVTITARTEETSVFAAGVASYTIEVTTPLCTIEDLKEFITSSTEVTKEFTFTDAVVTVVNGKSAFVEDETAGIYLYNIAEGLSAGDVLNGKTTLTAKKFNGQRQVTASTVALTNLVSETDAEIPVTTWTIAEIISNDLWDALENMHVKIERATAAGDLSAANSSILISQGESSITLYSRVALSIVQGNLVTVTGIVFAYNSTKEIAVYNASDVAVFVAPTIAANPTSVELPADGGSASIAVSTSDFSGTPTITAVSDNTAFTVSVSGTTVTVSAEANTTEILSGEITITATYGDDETASTKVSVIQEANQEDHTYFIETFNDILETGGRDGNFANSSNTAFTSSTILDADETWTSYNYSYPASECVKLGSSGSNSVFTTATINVSGSAKLSFEAAGWGSGTNTLAVSASGATLSGDTNITLTNSVWNTYSVNILNATGTVTITFSGKRLFLDNVFVYTGNMPTPKSNPRISFATESYSFALGSSDYNAFTGQQLTNPNSLTGIVYILTGDAIGAVNSSTGVVTLNGTTAGTATVKATFAGNGQYKEGEAVYTISVLSGSALTLDFENDASSYTDWTITTIQTQQTNSAVPAHGGSYYGGTDGKASGSIQTTNAIASPGMLKFYVSKESANNTASSWLVEVSSDGSNWEQVGDAQSASSGITRGEWTEVTRDLSSYSDVYVRIRYDGTTAKRCIDDVSLTIN